ncbi:MAG: ATP-grasp domain-containing protein [Asticcacaulis sp.]|uniref:ATP-grasp domain-containing protein n=1 Tax=Asticcacaulis sp. TaxID=1872648 RepID=UPI003F7BF451
MPTGDMSIPSPVLDATTQITGMNRIVPMAFRGQDLNPLWETMMARVTANPADAAAMMDMAITLQSLGRSEDARQVMEGALSLQRDFCVRHGDGSGLRLLAFVTAGDFMANTPLDFLLDGSNCVLWLRYVDAETTSLDGLPEHDVAFMAVGESNENGPVLARLNDLLADWPYPIMNNRPGLINQMTRDSVHHLLSDEPSICSPKTKRLDRQALSLAAERSHDSAELTEDLTYPVTIRPVGTHAGHGLVKLDGRADLQAYLAGQSESEFYVAAFIDYSDGDGLYTKQRIVLINGRPFASHQATSRRWMVHYMNADMMADADKRAAEAAWMDAFDTDFAVRHAAAFEALHRKIGLDYFGMDCAETRDGRLLIFELDVAMIVHDMDDPELFPYKRPAMRKLFAAFIAAAQAAAGGA